MFTPKPNNYKSIFFKLYLMISIYDCVVEVNMFFGLRLPLFDFVKAAYLDFSIISSFMYLNSAYILYSQCFLHFSIAINRLWAIWMSTTLYSRHNFWVYFGRKFIYFIPFLALPLLIPRYSMEAKYYVGDHGALGLRYVDADVKMNAVIAFLVVTITAFLSFICELITVIKFNQIMKSGNIINKKMRQELRLLGKQLQSRRESAKWFRFLGHALIILVIQLLMAGCQFFIYLSHVFQNLTIMQTAFEHFVWIDDLLNLSGPIALFIVSRSVRRDYWMFWVGDKWARSSSNVFTTQHSFKNHHPNGSPIAPMTLWLNVTSN